MSRNIQKLQNLHQLHSIVPEYGSSSIWYVFYLINFNIKKHGNMHIYNTYTHICVQVLYTIYYCAVTQKNSADTEKAEEPEVALRRENPSHYDICFEFFKLLTKSLLIVLGLGVALFPSYSILLNCFICFRSVHVN